MCDRQHAKHGDRTQALRLLGGWSFLNTVRPKLYLRPLGRSLPAGLEELGLHHIVVNSWDEGVDSQQNVVLISIPRQGGWER